MHAFPELLAGPWRLRALRHEDAEAWLAIVLDPELRRLTSWSIDTLEEMRRLVADYLEGPRTHTARRWAIVDATGELCGTCGFKDWDRDHRTAEIAYELAPAHRRRGAMSAIAEVVVAHGIEEMHLKVIHALVMVENAASIRLLEKLGFARTATATALRKCGGVWRDFHRYERGLAIANER